MKVKLKCSACLRQRYDVSHHATSPFELSILQDIDLNNDSDFFQFKDKNKKIQQKDPCFTYHIFISLLSSNWRELDSSS